MIFLDFLNNRCSIGKRKIKPLRKYTNDKGKTLIICSSCTEYAERRAYRIKR